MRPVVVLPSQFKITVRSYRLSLLGPNSPYHVPVNGCPSWATADTDNPRTATRQIKRPNLARILSPYAFALRYEQLAAVHGFLAAEHQLRAFVVVLTDVFKQIRVGGPAHGE